MAHATGKPQEHVRVQIHTDISHLTVTEQRVLRLLSKAVRLINTVYLEQMNQNLEKSAGIFDKSRNNNFYPEGMSRIDIETYLGKHPEKREGVLSPFTKVEKRNGKLYGLPYNVLYHGAFEEIASLLDEAAQSTLYRAFKNFLSLRAEAFRTNEWRASDVAWIKSDDSPFELIIGPYENYEDKLFGVKRDVEGILGVVLPEETVAAQTYQKEVRHFDIHLGKRYGYAAHTMLTPMVVIDEVAASGGSWYGFVPMACNLPNEQDIQQEVGSKKVFMRNVMSAKMKLITRRISDQVLGKHITPILTPSIFMNFVIGHESSHGISFRFNGENFLDLGSSLEEGKADIFGLIFLYFLADKNVIEKNIPEKAVMGHLVDGLRQIRFGLDEAHAIGSRIQYNWFLKSGALAFKGNGFEFKPELFRKTLEALGDALFTLSQTQSHTEAQKFIETWGSVPNEIRSMIQSFGNIPVDIDPLFKDY